MIYNPFADLDQELLLVNPESIPLTDSKVTAGMTVIISGAAPSTVIGTLVTSATAEITAGNNT